MQQLPDTENTDSKEEISCLKWKIYNGRRKVCVNFQTNTDKLKIVMYRQTLIVNNSHYLLNISIPRSEPNLFSMFSVFVLT